MNPNIIGESLTYRVTAIRSQVEENSGPLLHHMGILFKSTNTKSS